MNAIIVLNYNDIKTVKQFVEHIKPYGKNYHVVIVDNCSTDGSFEELRTLYGDVYDVIRTERNGGYAYGNNFGIRFAKRKYDAQYCIVANPDVLVEEKVLEKAIAFLETNDDVAIAGCKMINVNGTTETYCWKLPSYRFELISSLFILSRLLTKNKNLYSVQELSSSVTEVEAIAGSLMIMNVDSVMNVGGFDEDTFLYCEEQILGYKLKRAGYKVFVINNLTYVHNHSTSISKTYKSVLSKYKLHQQSKMVYLKKCLNIGKAKQILFLFVTGVGMIERYIGSFFIK